MKGCPPKLVYWPNYKIFLKMIKTVTYGSGGGNVDSMGELMTFYVPSAHAI
jgi:hypothetical protein